MPVVETALASARRAALVNLTNGYYGRPPVIEREAPEDPERLRAQVAKTYGPRAPAEAPPPRPKLRGDPVIQARDIAAGAGGPFWRPVARLDREGWLDKITIVHGATTNVDGSLLVTLHLVQNARPLDVDPDPVLQPGHVALTPRHTGSDIDNLQFPNAPGAADVLEIPFDRELTGTDNAIFIRYRGLNTVGTHTLGVLTVFRESPEPRPFVVRISSPFALSRSAGAAPLPRPRGPAMPRTVRIVVDMGALGGTSRIIPFGDLAPELRRLAINPQTGEFVGTRTIQPIW